MHGLAFGVDVGIGVEMRGLEDLKPIVEWQICLEVCRVSYTA